MSATYGRLVSSETTTPATKSGREYIEATTQTETVRAITTSWRDGRVTFELRATDDRRDSGRVLVRIEYAPPATGEGVALWIEPPADGLAIATPAGRVEL